MDCGWECNPRRLPKSAESIRSIDGIAKIVRAEERLRSVALDAHHLREAKALGFADKRIAEAPTAEAEVAKRRQELEIKPVFKTVDTCAAEFQAFTPYLYSSYDGEDEADPDGSQ